MRSGKCPLGLSIITCRLVTRNSRPPRSKKNPLKQVSRPLPAKVETRAVVSSSGSIMGAFAHTNVNLLFDYERFKKNCFLNAKRAGGGERKPKFKVL
jgi:hypothetical protein